MKKENLVKASKQILCSQDKVLVLIWDSEKNCVHRRWIQSYFRFHQNFVFTRESSTRKVLRNFSNILVLVTFQFRGHFSLGDIFALVTLLMFTVYYVPCTVETFFIALGQFSTIWDVMGQFETLFTFLTLWIF